jgi:hypothetical protein
MENIIGSDDRSVGPSEQCDPQAWLVSATNFYRQASSARTRAARKPSPLKPGMYYRTNVIPFQSSSPRVFLIITTICRDTMIRGRHHS